MTAFGRFEEIEVWKLSMELCTEVYKITNLDQFSKDFGLKDQIRRSAVSVPSNIAEGYERDGKNQFIYFQTFFMYKINNFFTNYFNGIISKNSQKIY